MAGTSAGQAPLVGARWDTWVGRTALGLALAPLVVAAVQLTVGVGGDYHPTSDLALTELVVRDVGSRPVLLGPYSRDGWHHPGPISAYLFAVPYRLLGSTSTALPVAALVVNGASVAGLAHLARRRAGLPLQLVTLLGCGLLLRALPPDVVRLPWNPSVTVLPYGALVFLTWALACRERWALPVAVAVASYLAQTHVGYVALAAPLLALGAGALVWSMARSGEDASLRDRLRPVAAPVAAAALVALVLWAAPVYEELTRDPGNLTETVRWFEHGGTSGESPRGWRAGWRLVSAQYSLTPEWVVGRAPVSPFTSESTYLVEPRLPLALVVVATAFAVLVRRRTPGVRPLAVVWITASAAGVAATARIVGGAYAYRNGWAWVLGMVGGVVVLWAGWTLVTTRWPIAARRLLVPATLAALAALAVATSVGLVDAGVPESDLSEQIAAVAPEVLDALPSGDGPVVVDGRSSWDGLVQGPGLILALERAGVDARFPTQTSAGPERVDPGGPVRARLVVVGGDAVETARDDPGLRLVAEVGAVGDAEPLAVLLREAG